MKRVTTGLVGLGLAASIGLAYASPGTAEPAPDVAGQEQTKEGGDALPQPLETKRQALRDTAITSVLNGDAKPVTKNGTSVVKVGKGHTPADAAALANEKATEKQRQAAEGSAEKDQYVELAQERSDKIFVILAEFGDERHPDFPDLDTNPNKPGPTTFEGPLRNKIPEPDRSKDNTTVWQADYDRQHYQDMYFDDSDGAESVKTYYETQSSGQYTVDGTVSDWVKVPYNEARYGRDDTSKTTWNLIQDSITAWVADQKADGKTDAEIKEAIASYDEYDRYDFDGDGNFNESDGYVDHFQIVHAGGDEADGDPQQGEDAIWSHRWYAFYTDQGLTGPQQNKLGGTQV
ncbi:immune inhibitor A domain-containing protein, partial [Aeromicrobium sp.]|uniref:immune inhibitor A domain-containing protein n=1 Tax=Aeromicrobium sp. TaxID=1871063 RepID=UPI003D6A7DA8